VHELIARPKGCFAHYSLTGLLRSMANHPPGHQWRGLKVEQQGIHFVKFMELYLIGNPF